MTGDQLVYAFFLIFSSAAVLATVALYTRQPLIVAYIAVGALLGPSVTGLISDPSVITGVGEIGIIFLLFLLGLDMEPAKLTNMFGKAAGVGIASSLLFFAAGFGVAWGFDYSTMECAVIGIAMMFSSTIVGIKLLPTTLLHHRHTGELVVSQLLIQDLIAIIVLLVITGGILDEEGAMKAAFVLLAFPALILGAWLFVRFVLLPLLAKFDAFHEYIFLVAIGWCLGLAEISRLAGLSLEIGAFIAGVSIATSPIAMYIATSLKPLRDFFLVLFFFALGAGFKLGLLGEVVIPAVVLAAVILTLKPLAFRILLSGASESPKLAWEIGFRLGQISEFSLMIALLAATGGLIGDDASHLIQATAILTFLVSSYIVVFRYPSPIAVSDKLRRD